MTESTAATNSAPMASPEGIEKWTKLGIAGCIALTIGVYYPILQQMVLTWKTNNK